MIKNFPKVIQSLQVMFCFYFPSLLVGNQAFAQRGNQVVIVDNDTKAGWEVKTYYEEDKDIDIGGKTVQGEYQFGVTIEPLSSGNYTAMYRGPVYAQCSGGQCSVQGYKIELDSCGRIVEFKEKDGPFSELLRYNPGDIKDNDNEKAIKNHEPLTKVELDRVKFYANNPKILAALYEDIAGKDRQSNYVLGNTSTVDGARRQVQAAQAGGEDTYKKLGGGSRWGLNPWGTNTLATFFIHMDMIRRSMQKKMDMSACPDWPKYQGKTPVPHEADDSDQLIDQIVADFERKKELAQKRIDNFHVESLMNSEAKRCDPSMVMSYRKIMDFTDNATEVISSMLDRLGQSISTEEKKAIEEELAKLDDSQGKAHLMLAQTNLNLTKQKLEQAQNFKKVYENAIKDKLLSDLEKEEIFDKFKKLYQDKIMNLAIGDQKKCLSPMKTRPILYRLLINLKAFKKRLSQR